MTLKKPHTLRSLDEKESDQLEENLQILYRNKLESRYHYAGSSTATAILAFQSMETGQAVFSANGSQAVLRSFPLTDTIGTVTFAVAHAQHNAILARVTDVTNTSISIEASVVSSTALFSSVTTAVVSVRWQVINSSP